jgi:trk system potassium uptake protein TrkA
MNIIVVGCGKIGTVILSSLVAEGHNVTAIDSNDEVVNQITNVYDVMGACGNALDAEVLSEVGIESTDLFISVTGSDDFNMLSCYIARKMGAKHTIARIRNPEYNKENLTFMKHQLQISVVINPDSLAAQELYTLLQIPSAAKVETFSQRNFEVVELKIKPNSVLDGINIIDFRKKYSHNFLICAVQRGEEFFIPEGNFELRAGDVIGISSTPAVIRKLLRNIGITQKQAKNVMLLGASRISYYLAKMLVAEGNEVKIVEKDYDICNLMSEKVPEVTMICGDGANQDLLIEEGLLSTDAFVSLTGMDEENILISYFAQSQNVPKVISKVNRDEFSAMAEKLELESIISPRKISANVVVRYARALQNTIGNSSMETLYKLMDGKAEAIEFKIRPETRFVKVFFIKRIRFHNNFTFFVIMCHNKPCR